MMNDWYVWFGVIAVVVMGAVCAYRWFCLPTAEQVANIKEWLKYAVSMAEKELGSGTGQLKLRQVYDAFLVKFPKMALIVPFYRFSDWVDEALVWLKGQLESNNKVERIING